MTLPKSRREIFKIDQMKMVWKIGDNEVRCDGAVHYVWVPSADHVQQIGPCDCKSKSKKS
ncbi:MAG: hypothetical protein KGJ09_05515 [Candidatus Omnitrophica bacterium]|nr:hypothetical protein [Candidatus Omnitrophota bacterium]MDE2009522.1 hypothetical protein [Candidatus Omnitrophota bacterium]MDE2214566.1 hypothetical protein [Candidatus Omnitrophota bacterium]MDE2231643.1 hypothetical protein [Candidatus Omnitrophota bacterium]